MSISGDQLSGETGSIFITSNAAPAIGTAAVSDIATLPNAPSSLLGSTTVASLLTETTTVEVKTLNVIWPGTARQADRDPQKATVKAKFRRFLGSSYAPSTLGTTGYYAEAFHAFGPGKEQRWSLGQRYAAAYADTQSNAFFEDFLVPSLTHQDPIYHRGVIGSTAGRFTYAISRVFVASDDDGGSSFNTSSVVGAFISSELHNAYHPYGNLSASGTAGRALGRLATRAGMNVVREFWPDVRHRILSQK